MSVDLSRRLFVSLPAAAVAARLLKWAPSAVAAEPAEWIPLFDGKSLDGWTQRGGKANYKVEDGVILGSSVPNTSNSFLCTEKDYGDFILEYEFKVAARERNAP